MLAPLALLLSTSMVVGACSSDSSDEKADSKTETTKPAGEGAGGPVKIVLLMEQAGESEVAVPDYVNGAEMAIAEINEAGGINGAQIEVKRIPTSVINPTDANASFTKGLDEKPTVMIGLISPTVLAGAAPNIEKGQVPVLSPTIGGDDLRFGNDGGSEFTWMMDYEGAVADAAIGYMTDDLKLEKIGLMGDNVDYGTEAIAFAKESLKRSDREAVTVQQFEPTATDLTKEVQAVKASGADGVLNVAYPNPLAVQLNQFQQNGLAIPTVSFGSSPFVVNFQMAKGDALKDFYGVEACNFGASEDAAAKTFSEEYQKRFPDLGPPSYFAGYTYDLVYIAKAAIEKAGSNDPVAVNDALKDITVTDNIVCGKKYEADGSHFLRRDGVIVSYGPDSPPGKIVETFEIPLLDKP